MATGLNWQGSMHEPISAIWIWLRMQRGIQRSASLLRSTSPVATSLRRRRSSFLPRPVPFAYLHRPCSSLRPPPSSSSPPLCEYKTGPRRSRSGGGCIFCWARLGRKGPRPYGWLQPAAPSLPLSPTPRLSRSVPRIGVLATPVPTSSSAAGEQPPSLSSRRAPPPPPPSSCIGLPDFRAVRFPSFGATSILDSRSTSGFVSEMQEVFDPPEMERETETKIGTGTSIRKEPDLGSSYQLWGNMKFEEDHQLLSQAKRGLSHVDYHARPAESNYVTDLRSHAYSEDPLPLGREYHRQKSYLPTSSCWEKSFAFEAAPSSPDALGHVLGKMRTKTNNLSARPDYLGSYPTNAPHMRKHLGEVELDYGLNHSEHCYRRSGRFTAFSSRNGQSVEHCNEMVDYARGPRYRDDINPISRQWCLDDGGPLLPRGLQYGDEIPSLSSKKYNGAPSHSGQWHYGPQTPLFSRRYEYGDEIPSLSRSWRYRDKIPLQSGHWCHDAEAHAPSRYRQGASHRNGHSRQIFTKINTNEQAKVTTRMVNRPASSSDHYRTNMKDNRCRNPEKIMDQVRGPRANKLNNTSASSPVKDIISPLVCRDQFNRSDFSVQYKQAKFFMIKSYSEDDIHKGIKYNVWASTANGNNKLDAAYHDAQILMKENGEKCPVFLFFSVNTSGQFVGLAEMLGPVDFKKTMDFWKEDKWNGFFPIIWHIIKDIPNRLFRHIILEYNDGRPVTFSRDTQEIGLLQGVQMLKIFKDHPQGTSILDDFDFYEEKDNARRAQKRENSESTHQSGFPEDLEPMGSLEASMESWSLHDKWD